MKLTIDQTNLTLVTEDQGKVETFPLYSPEAFRLISDQWVKVGWGLKYSYSFTWLGRPAIQLPEDFIRVQEVFWSVKPDVVLECGVAHGGGLIFFSSLCKILGRGRVIGVDIEIRPHNRQAIESHFLAPYITLIEGSSVAKPTVEKVNSLIRPGEKVLVILDSNHERQHVFDELEAYSHLVHGDSYIVATDGIMKYLEGVPNVPSDWKWNNPVQAALDFVAKHPEFEIVEPPFLFQEGKVQDRITYWPSSYIRRK